MTITTPIVVSEFETQTLTKQITKSHPSLRAYELFVHKDSTLKNCMGLPLPDKFSGKKKSEAKSFKSQFERVFKLQPRRFADDETKILYVAIFLSGAANS